MKTSILIFLSSLLMTFTISAKEKAKEKTTKTVIVLPADSKFLKAAQELTKIRPVSICTYSFKASSKTPTMRFWEKSSGKWQDTDMEDYEAMSTFEDFPNRMLLLMTTKTDKEVMIPASEWCFNIKSLSKPDMKAFKANIKLFFLLSDDELASLTNN